MIPLRDNIPSRTTPFVNYAVIAACTFVFLTQLSERGARDDLVGRYGMVPARVMKPGQPIDVTVVDYVRTIRGLVQRKSIHRLPSPPVHPWLTLVTCIFLHGGWMHFLGNMWILYIFGDNVEDRFGHLGYALFYIGCGIAASAAHLLANMDSIVPTIGASGAIAGVMGAYFLLYPRAKVLTVLPIFFFLQLIVLPAPIFLGIWVLIQFYQGTFAILSTQATGVAWWAHIGGFVAGLLIALQLKGWGKLRLVVDRVLPGTRRSTTYRVRRGKSPWS